MLVIIADDQPPFRQALKQTIQHAYNKFADAPARIPGALDFIECATAEEIHKAFARNTRIDWLVSDLALQSELVFKTIEWIKQAQNPPKLIIVSAYSSANEVAQAFQLGVDGFIAKQQDMQSIEEAFLDILRGRRAISLPPTNVRFARPNVSPMSNGLTNMSTQGQAENLGPMPPSNLTSRENQVLLLLADGYSNKEIALELGITEHTVKVHLTKIFRALQVTSRTQALAKLMRGKNPTAFVPQNPEPLR